MAWRILDKWFLINIVAGIFFINLFFYALFYHFYSLLPTSELAFSFKITGQQLFPEWGFLLCFVPSLISFIILFLSARISDFTQKIFIHAVAIIAAALFSTLFIPINIPMWLIYLLFIGAITGVTALRHPSIYKIAYSPKPKNSFSKQKTIIKLRLTHNRLLFLARETLWVLFTVIVASSLVMFAYLSSMAEHIIQQNQGLRVFFQGETIFFEIFLFYVAAFSVLGGSMFCYRQLLLVEKQLTRQ